jgi:hypothetical protein
MNQEGTLRFSPAQAYWNQRRRLSASRQRILALFEPADSPVYPALLQWAQLMAVVLEFKAELILELGQGRGNPTCAFTEAANLLR